MKSPSLFRPKRQQWLLATTAIAGVSLVLAIGVRWWRGWSAGDVWGLSFGILAALLMVLGALYGVRRRLMVSPLRTAQDWLQVHVYGSTLAALFVLIHMGFEWPGGQFGWWLLGLTLWTTLSGLVGVGLQKWVPAMLAAQLTVEVIYDRIPEMLDRLRAEATKTMEGGSDVLQRFYDAQVQPGLAGLAPSWSYLFDARSGRDQRLAPFEHFQAFVGDGDKERLADLKMIVSEKLEIEAHYSLQRILRLWPLTHVPPAMLLLALVVAHVAAVWYF
jgi:hypothetical protein